MSSNPKGSVGSTGGDICPVGDLTESETLRPGTSESYVDRRAKWIDSFRHRDFRFLWTSVLFHSLGMGMERVALGWLVFDLTDSPFMVGLTFAARQVRNPGRRLAGGKAEAAQLRSHLFHRQFLPQTR